MTASLMSLSVTRLACKGLCAFFKRIFAAAEMSTAEARKTLPAYFLLLRNQLHRYVAL